MKDNCFTEFCDFLSYINRNQPQAQPCALPPRLLSRPPPHPVLQPVTEPLFEFPESYSKFPPNPGIEPRSPALWADSLPAELPGKPKNTGMGSLFLLQGIFPTQESNPGLPHCRWILYQPRHKESPRILEWIAYPFSSGSSPPKNQTGVSCIAGRFFTNWAIREALLP